MLSHFLGGSLLCEQTADAGKVVRIFEADKPCGGVAVKVLEQVTYSVAVGVLPVFEDLVNHFATLFDDDGADDFPVKVVRDFVGVVQYSVHIKSNRRVRHR